MLCKHCDFLFLVSKGVCLFVNNLLHGLFSPNYLWDRRLALQNEGQRKARTCSLKYKWGCRKGKVQDTQLPSFSVFWDAARRQTLMLQSQGSNRWQGMPMDTLPSPKRWGCHFKEKVHEIPLPLLYLGTTHAIADHTCQYQKNPRQT